jgi:hypothetical protein
MEHKAFPWAQRRRIEHGSAQMQRMRSGSIFFEDSPIFIPMVFDFARADESAADIPIGMN